MSSLRNLLDESNKHFVPVYNNKKRGRRHMTNIL